MKFKIKRSVLLSALSNVSRAVSQKVPLPSLTGIKFDLTEEGLTLTGSDSDITIQTTITEHLEVIDPGAVVLSSKYILEIIRKIDSDEVLISIVDGTLTRIEGGSAKFSLNGSPAGDYPRVDLSKKGVHVVIKSFTLRDIIEKTVFATSDKETRPILTGVNFKAAGTQLTALATDSYRVAENIVELGEEQSFNIVVPKKSLQEISRIIEKDALIDVYVEDHKILFVIDNYVILSRLIDGTFPDTTKLLAPSYDYSLEVNAGILLSAVDRAALLSEGENNIVTLNMEGEKVKLTSQSQEIGSVEENLANAFYKGDQLEISFSAKYLTDAIRSINTDTIKMQFKGTMKPIVITDVERDDNIQVILPVRTY
jgi:DNA polymerase-3 subunit beta